MQRSVRACHEPPLAARCTQGGSAVSGQDECGAGLVSMAPLQRGSNGVVAGREAIC